MLPLRFDWIDFSAPLLRGLIRKTQSTDQIKPYKIINNLLRKGVTKYVINDPTICVPTCRRTKTDDHVLQMSQRARSNISDW